MKPRPFAQRFIAYLCCWLINVPFLAQAHTMGPNGPVVEPVPVREAGLIFLGQKIVLSLIVPGQLKDQLLLLSLLFAQITAQRKVDCRDCRTVLR